MAYAAVPQLVGLGQAPAKGAYLISDYVDMKLAKHEFHIKSAGVAIPKAVDQIVTIKTLA
jgi:DNA-binding protein